MNADHPCRIVQLGGLCWCVRESALKDIREICADVDTALSHPVKIYKNSRNITAAAVVSPSGGRFVIRRMNYGTFRHRFKDFFRPSRARRAFFRGLRLEQAGIPTPRMLAVAESRRLRWPLAAWLISDEVPAAQPLAASLRRPEHVRGIVERLAGVVARMHDRGFIHRDLKPSNILLDADSNPWLIDMDGVHFVAKVSPRQAAGDLRVLATLLKKLPHLRLAALRFLITYCQRRALSSSRRQIAQLIGTI